MYEEHEQRGLLICEMDASQRPREKFLAEGTFDNLSDAEVMAIIFATGVKGMSVVDLCNQILEKNQGHLSLIIRKKVKELMAEHKGIGPVKAITLLAALELGRRASLDAKNMAASLPFKDSEDVYERMKHRFLWLKHEEFWVVYLDRGLHILKEECVSRGGTAATVVDTKIIIRKALECYASSMVLCHNHPSGTMRPSGEDDNITRKVIDAARLFDMRVYDHIIFTDGGYYSYGDKSRL